MNISYVMIKMHFSSLAGIRSYMRLYMIYYLKYCIAGENLNNIMGRYKRHINNDKKHNKSLFGIEA
jgi:hypothetical protein